MTVHYSDEAVTLHLGDCLDVLTGLPDASIDSVVCDPPYGLANTDPAHVTDALVRWINGERDFMPEGAGFMGKAWDAFVPPPAVWDECLRVLKPGGHLLCFAGTRTVDLMGLSIRLAGFDIRDSLAWIYGSGFPKSLDVGKAIDKMAGAKRVVVGPRRYADGSGRVDAWPGGPNGHEGWQRPGAPTGGDRDPRNITAPATPAAQQWQGWGTALKPAWESVVHAVKPQTEAGRIGSYLEGLEAQCRPSANSAASNSAHSLRASDEAKTASVPGSAATPHGGEPGKTTATGAAAGSSDQTATSWSDEQASTYSNIVRSWRNCWDALSAPANTSTTATTSSTTTDLTTLWSCLSRITGPNTLVDLTSPDGLSSLARAADNLFAAAVLSSNATRELTATESATSPTLPSSPDGGADHLEPVIVARKPFPGNVATNVLTHGTGALNIDASRVSTSPADAAAMERANTPGSGRMKAGGSPIGTFVRSSPTGAMDTTRGRWPANVLLDEGMAARLDQESGTLRSSSNKPGQSRNAQSKSSFVLPDVTTYERVGDSGGASRYFKVFERDSECDQSPTSPASTSQTGSLSPTSGGDSAGPAPDAESSRPSQTKPGDTPRSAPGATSERSLPSGTDFPVFRYQAKAPTSERPKVEGVAHATVKPLALMRWLVRLVTPPGGTVLEPFAGSGTTVEAAILEGFQCVAIEREPDYLPLIRQRIDRAHAQAATTPTADPTLFDEESA